MNQEKLLRLKKAFEYLESKAASNQELNCGDLIMIGMAIDLINHEMATLNDVKGHYECLEKCPETLRKVHAAINKYYLALDKREHGGRAQDQAFNEIQQALGIHWQPGEALKESEHEK